MAFFFGEHDQVITIYAKSANGPGWHNFPLWIIVRSKLDGALRLECIQPEEQTAEMHILYKISEASHNAMMEALKAYLRNIKKY